MTLSGSEWIGRYAERLGLDMPAVEEAAMLLNLAGIAAHCSERTAAPISCWLAARAGISAAEALAIAEKIRDELVVEAER
ncbi:MAG TPA: DUF6457 domain-containing protein [Acidimicrobiales bacterium]|nr:DUF6457 domain-containing protein [Acidimicrobiales bacterium]